MYKMHCMFTKFIYLSLSHIRIIFIRLDQLDKTNEKLDSINRLSAKHYLDATRDFTNHTQMLTTMKTDLDLIFKRIKYNQINSINFP
jgi:hypothetical protein